MRVSVVYDFFASVYVKHIWTFEGYCRRFSVGPRKEESRAVEGDALREREEPALRRVIVSVSRLPQLGQRDCRDAFVRLGRGHEAGQAGALVGSLRVGALPVLAQGHLVADVLTLVYVCRKTEKAEEARLNHFYYFLPWTYSLPSSSPTSFLF